MNDNNPSHCNIGMMLKSLLKEHSLSLRKLAELTGIHASTISRMINGKQMAKPEHLQLFAKTFQIPLKQWLMAAGIEIGEEEEGTETSYGAYIGMIQETMGLDEIGHGNIVSLVERELENYERYALTEEGEQLIYERFHKKTQQIDGTGPFIMQLREMYAAFSDISIQRRERAILGGVLLYFILSTDVIPDYLFPIGYLDDAIAIRIGLDRLKLVSKSTMSFEDAAFEPHN
ncbi:helix-turn-helix domain-containing protein [Paenibacillus paeoniae]|uniref:Helix-turn-helix domain-containing protein n=1 Tax=Paenibacillus paeoniae TaxID=2292705 RepID=A0A371P6C7_9BACL|nr:helix-turn-helix domain-containing protein [Paenibacillus paeoniae]REK71507.1 helix-turn-helix domain-containing protein [Paenibacillus paeoniae]